jgi:transcriptional regulator with XRE-family HTH domain
VGRSIHSREREVLVGLLREVRLEAGLKQVEVAEALEAHQSFVSRYESGERGIDLVDLRRLVLALGLTLPDFVARYEAALEADGA